MALSAEFDTDNTDDVIQKILEKGTLQISEVSPLSKTISP
jgi:ribosome maturation protein Sdo1